MALGSTLEKEEILIKENPGNKQIQTQALIAEIQSSEVRSAFNVINGGTNRGTYDGTTGLVNELAKGGDSHLFIATTRTSW
jgi:hypothetical protein